MLLTTLSKQAPIPWGDALKSRIVFFEHDDGQLLLYESAQDHVVSQQIPSAFLLGSFKILKETPTEVFFDLGSGLNHVFVAAGTHANDRQGTEYQPSFMTVPVLARKVRKVEISPANVLLVEFLAQFAPPPSSPGASAPLENTVVFYSLAPYRPNPTFKPRPSERFHSVGFFESTPRHQDGRVLIHSTKFATDKPIVFAISANTPKEFYSAVKQGVLYWNRTFPKPILQVVDAPEGVHAPDPRYNMVQWVPWDRAGFAQADLQIDPRTGEIVRADVFITSSMALMGRDEARKFITTTKSGNLITDIKKVSALANLSPGYASTRLCDRDLSANIRDGMPKLLEMDLGQSSIHHLAAAYIASTVAHEIGHALGLRHNFAGSAVTSHYEVADRPRLLERFIKDRVIDPKVEAASTVMDYLPFVEDTIVGHKVIEGHPALPYDKKAIESLYENRHPKPGDLPLFCTDSQVGHYFDCNKFDAGKSPVEYALVSTKERARSFAYELVDLFVTAKSGKRGSMPVFVTDVQLDASSLASDILSPSTNLLSRISSETSILSVRIKNPLNSIEMHKEEEKSFLVSEIQRQGGIARVFAKISPDYATKVLSHFDQILKFGQYAMWTDHSGNLQRFTTEEEASMRALVDRMLQKLPEQLALRDVSMLKQFPSGWKDLKDTLSEDLLTHLVDRTRHYVLTQKKEGAIAVALSGPWKKVDGKMDPETLEIQAKLPVFAFSKDLRTEAADLIQPGKAETSIAWGIAEKKALKAELAKTLDDALGCGMEKLCHLDSIDPKDVKVKTDGLSAREAKAIQQQVTAWMIENKAILKKFD